MAPQSWNGAEFIYFKVIRPFVLRYEGEIDSHLTKARKLAEEAGEECEYSL